MNGQNQSEEFNEFISNPNKITIHADVVLDESTKNWTVTFLLMGSGFSFSEIKPIGKGNAGLNTAKSIAEKINNFQKKYDIMKEALELSLPDDISGNDNLDDYQKFVLTEARKASEE